MASVRQRSPSEQASRDSLGAKTLRATSWMRESHSWRNTEVFDGYKPESNKTSTAEIARIALLDFMHVSILNW